MYVCGFVFALPGNRCEMCADGYFGDPQGRYGARRPWPLPEQLAIEAAGVYQETFAALTGRSFEPAAYPAAERVAAALRGLAR